MSNPYANWLIANDSQRFNLANKQGWKEFAESDPRTPVPPLPTRGLRGLSDDELEDYNEARMVWNANPPTVKTAQLLAAFSIIKQVMSSNYRDGDKLRGSVVIDAAPALGKTTIATRYAKDYHRRMVTKRSRRTAAGHVRVPVAFIPLDASVTLKGLNQKILSFYEHPAAEHATTSRLASRAVDCVRSCETQLIVIDDLHFVDFKHRRGQEVSNHLKGLANEMPATFVYVGVRLNERRFFNEGLLGEDALYAQTSRRATRVPVSAFTTSTDAGAQAWTILLQALEGHLLLLNNEPGMLTRHAKELFRRTQGHMGSLTNLLDRACDFAIESGRETIDSYVLDAITIDNAAELSSLEL